MNPKRCLAYLALLLSVVAVGACERAKSANPLSPDVAGPIPGVSITAPKPLEPSAGMEVLNDGKPQTLLIENAGTSGERQLWMQVELASDGAFQQVTHHADRVALGEGGRTTYRLPEPLKAGHTYYWRARAMDGANTGPYSAVAHFKLIDPVVIETPTPLEPSGLLTNNRPNFVVRNGRVTGPAGDIVYRFEFGTAPDQPPAAVLTAVPGSNGTTTVTLGDLPFDRTLFWRVWATDGSTQSPFSSILSFRTPAAPKPPPPPPTPPPPPPGGGGGGVPGGGGGRTPDPGPGRRLPLPNMSHVVNQVASARPDLLRNSCQDHGGSWGFMDLVVDTLRTYDTRWGYNGKRGNGGDPSHDVVDYHYGNGNSEGSTEVYIIDIIGGHCGSNPSAAWGDVTGATAASNTFGRWISRGRF